MSIIIFLSGCHTTCTYNRKKWLESNTDSANWIDTVRTIGGETYLITKDTVLGATISIKHLGSSLKDLKDKR